MKDDAWNDGFDDYFSGASEAEALEAWAIPTNGGAYLSGFWAAKAYSKSIHSRPAEPRDTEIADLKEWTK